MALEQYDVKLPLDGDLFWYRPKKFTLPTEAHKYLLSRWNKDYTWFRLSYLVYGTDELYWLLMATNDITDPYGMEEGDSVRILLPDFLNEVS